MATKNKSSLRWWLSHIFQPAQCILSSSSVKLVVRKYFIIIFNKICKIEDHEKPHLRIDQKWMYTTFNPISFLLLNLLFATKIIVRLIFVFVLCAFCVTNDAHTWDLKNATKPRSFKDKVCNLDGNIFFFQWLYSTSNHIHNVPACHSIY